ncbi:head GIN domain-containing protein [Chloroflexota bacterium]
MKHRIILMLGSLIVVSLACALPELPSISQEILTGSGTVVTREEPITGFDKVDISDSFNVEIHQSEEYKVVIRVDNNLVEYLQVEKQGSTLKIGLKPGISMVSNATLEAEITMPELAGLDLSGASDATISGFKSTNNLTVDLSGSSSLGGDIESGDASFDLSGSSDANLSGSGGNLTLDASGSSDVDLSEFPVADANLEVRGASTAIVNPSGVLNVEASGASDVYYLGNPSLGNIDASGASSVDHK